MKINDNPQLQQEAQQANRESVAKPASSSIPQQNTVSNHINNYEAGSQAAQAKRPIAQQTYNNAVNSMKAPEQMTPEAEQLGLNIPLNKNEEQRALDTMKNAVSSYKFSPTNQAILDRNPGSEQIAREYMMNNLSEDDAIRMLEALALLKR